MFNGGLRGLVFEKNKGGGGGGEREREREREICILI